MKKLLSLLLVATIITSTLCVSYFAIENVDNLSTITTSEPTEEETTTMPSSVIDTSDEETTVPSSTDGSTTETSTEPSSSISTPDEPTITVTSIKLSINNYTMYSKQYLQLRATVKPDDANNKRVTWKSSNSKVATVDKNGKVVARGKGTCVITVSAVDGSKVKAKCNITVKQLVTSVKINKSTALIKKKGKTTTLKATVYPTNADNKKVTWSVGKSYKKNISVNSKGVVKALKNNTFGWVYATVKDGSKKSAKCLVIVGNRANKVQIGKYSTKNVKTKKGTKKVKKFTKLNNLRIDLKKGYVFDKRVTNETTKKIKKGKKTIKKTSYKKVAYVGVTWKSSNPKVVSVDKTGKIKGLRYGSAYIYATTMDGSRKTAKCKVTVPKLVSKITFNKGLNGNIDRDGYRQLKVTVEPKDATNKSVTWTSSNTKVATVNKNGKVKGVGNGSATITATAKDGSKKKAGFKVTVKVGMHTKMTKKEFHSNKKYIDMYCKALNDYFESCGAYIDYDMKYVDEGQWCVYSSDRFQDGKSIYDLMVGSVCSWTLRLGYDNMCATLDEWKGWKTLTDDGLKFLDEVDRVGSWGTTTYNPKKMLDMNWNGWKYYCDLINSKSRCNRPLRILVKAEPIDTTDIYDNPITIYKIKMYWG